MPFNRFPHGDCHGQIVFLNLPFFMKQGDDFPRGIQYRLFGQRRPGRQMVEIPKPGGGVRQLGIPTALDRLIQQALCGRGGRGSGYWRC